MAQKLTAAFEFYDENGDGVLTYDEIQNIVTVRLFCICNVGQVNFNVVLNNRTICCKLLSNQVFCLSSVESCNKETLILTRLIFVNALQQQPYDVSIYKKI